MTAQSILGNTRRPDISFSPCGKIDISSRIVKALGIRKGDVIDIMADGSEFYLYISIPAGAVIGRHESRTFPTQRGSRHFRAYSNRLCRYILRAAGLKGGASFPAGDTLLVNGRKAIPIIIKMNINNHG